MRCGILTISTGIARGERQGDASGDAIEAMVTAAPLTAAVTTRSLVPDDRAQISAQLRAWADGGQCDVILTTGGTGFSPTDITPEATQDVCERMAPNLAEAMRVATAQQTPLAWLSRGTAGARGRTLIVNLPGSPKAVRECLAVLIPLLPHAVAVLTEQTRQHE